MTKRIRSADGIGYTCAFVDCSQRYTEHPLLPARPQQQNTGSCTNQHMAASATPPPPQQRLPAQAGRRADGTSAQISGETSRSDSVKTVEQVRFYQPLNTGSRFSSSVGDGRSGRTFGHLCQTGFMTDELAARGLRILACQS